MILDENGAREYAQSMANSSNRKWIVYKNKTSGGYVICAEGMISEMRKHMPANTQLELITHVTPYATTE